MAALQYEAPDTLEEAVGLLARANGVARVLAGGTDVIVQMQTDVLEPALLVDIKRIAGLRRIEEDHGSYRVGAAVTCMQLMDHAAFCKAWPGVIDAIRLIGSIQVKSRATMGGNLCNASPAADAVPALIAADVMLEITGPKGMRRASVVDVLAGPGKTSLARDEILCSFVFPRRPPHCGDAYQRLTPRTEMDIAVVGIGLNLALDDAGVCRAARVALGAVAPTALLVKEAGKALVGSKVDEAAIERMAEAASAACRPIDDKRGTREYRVKTAGVLARRVAHLALERARSN